MKFLYVFLALLFFGCKKDTFEPPDRYNIEIFGVDNLTSNFHYEKKGGRFTVTETSFEIEAHKSEDAIWYFQAYEKGDSVLTSRKPTVLINGIEQSIDSTFHSDGSIYAIYRSNPYAQTFK